jgi:maltose O-acetyltransferase
MGNYLHRIVDAALASEFVPVTIRMPVMRWFGYNIHHTACIWARANIRSKMVKIGPGVFINVGFFHDGWQMLEIGPNVRIGQFVRVITGTHIIGPPSQRCTIDAVGGPVVIGEGSWIGCNVTIMPNVVISKGNVIAAGAVVTRSTQPNGLYAGIPARLVRVLDNTA